MFNYFLSDESCQVTKKNDLWKAQLPIGREAFLKNSRKDISSDITYGDYFCAASSFLEKNGFKIILQAALDCLKYEIDVKGIKEVNIFLEKHGQFYHPARVEIKLDENILIFVLNCAISDGGKACIKREYEILNSLGNDFSFAYLPRVYGIGEVCTNTANKSILMFLGQWFKDFNEFHVSQGSKGKIKVWDQGNDDFFLTIEDTLELHTQVGKILTYYYNMETFEQIFPWHHAAGDFVVKKEKDELLLRLVTARQYAPMFENASGDPMDSEVILDALYLFFINLSMRMRLDRFDGVGDTAWLDKIAVQGALNGLLQGLAIKAVPPCLNDSVDLCFTKYLLNITKEDLHDSLESVLDSYNRLSPEVDIIKNSIYEHGDLLYNVIKNTCKGI